MRECWTYNLTSNVHACYIENPQQILFEQYPSIIAIIIVVAAIAYVVLWYHHKLEASP